MKVLTKKISADHLSLILIGILVLSFIIKYFSKTFFINDTPLILDFIFTFFVVISFLSAPIAIFLTLPLIWGLLLLFSDKVKAKRIIKNTSLIILCVIILYFADTMVFRLHKNFLVNNSPHIFEKITNDLEQYRKQQGNYPKKLDDIQQDYLKNNLTEKCLFGECVTVRYHSNLNNLDETDDNNYSIYLCNDNLLPFTFLGCTIHHCTSTKKDDHINSESLKETPEFNFKKEYSCI